MREFDKFCSQVLVPQVLFIISGCPEHEVALGDCVSKLTMPTSGKRGHLQVLNGLQRLLPELRL